MPDINKTCSELGGTQLEYCRSMARECLEQEGSAKITLHPLDGRTLQFDDTYECVSFAEFRAAVGVP